ncbi:hypothetical protein [Flavobacterium sp. UBA7663]|uniref:hypothetical protein n=1 Tax=Flavobacterium sp. UBA7663 TaxID=1946557 RepID=UPI0025C28BCF|nr:hypothetical protein [Flavobacterium sp. UBA7663]
MAELLDSTQTQQATSSDQGTNKVAKLDAKSFFFLEDGVFATQTAAQSFGIIDENQFRTTSIVSVTNKKVISICKGQIFIQPMTGDDTKVNLILKPYIQPINGISIKYFIYRGLSKSNFIEPNGEVKLTGNGLITHIQNEFTNFYQNHPPIPEFLARYIGYPDDNTTQAETDLIDSYFYKISQSYDGDAENLVDPTKNFEFPIIPAGTHLATETGSIGLDIVLNYGDYYVANDQNPFKFDLEFARAASNIINVSGITNAYQKKLARETITQFLDPAAYYGLHANDGGKIFRHGQTQPIVTPQDVATLIDKFATKNTIYIYVQSNRQRSYNFYNKYVVSETNANNLKIGLSETTLTETTFETNSWPVKVFTAAPEASSTKQTIALQFTTDKNPNVSLYGDMAQIGSVNQENFVEAKDLIPVTVEGVPETPFTKTVLLHSPIANNHNIASFIQLVYIGKNIILSKPGIDDGNPDTPDDILFTTKYMDDVFDLINAISFLQADKIYHVHSYKPLLFNQGELDKNRKRVIAFTQRTQNTIAVSETENLTLFTYLAIVENEQSSHSNFSPTSSSDKTATGYSQQYFGNFQTLPNLPGNEYIEIKPFTDTGETLNGIVLKTVDGSLPTSLVLGITEEEQQKILDLINTNNLINPKIYFRNVLESEDDFFKSIENIEYKKYVLAITAENSIGEVTYFNLSEDITIYTLDGVVFTSLSYNEKIIFFNKESFNLPLIL